MTPAPTPEAAPTPVETAPPRPIPTATPAPPTPPPGDPLTIARSWWVAYQGPDVRLDTVIIREDWYANACQRYADIFGCSLKPYVWLNPQPAYWYDYTSVLAHELGHFLDYDENDGPAIMWYSSWTGYDVWCSVEVKC